MPYIASVGTAVPPYAVSHKQAKAFARDQFSEVFRDIDRLLTVFDHAQIDNRYLSAPLEWFKKEHGMEEKNRRYVSTSVDIGSKAIEECLRSANLKPRDIDAIFFVSSTGLSTPSIDALLINRLGMRPDIRRTPIWGLGCVGGAAGLTLAMDYTRAYPRGKVLLLALELCGLTFLPGDQSKSNLIATSLFADGAACALIIGDEAEKESERMHPIPYLLDSLSTFWQDTLDIMGWKVIDEGLKVVFSKEIPVIVKNWLRPNVTAFLNQHNRTIDDLDHLIAHPGGMKVLSAYQKALALTDDRLFPASRVLRNYGNMSSPTVLFVLKEIMQKARPGEQGLITALGPGFCSELLLVEWR